MRSCARCGADPLSGWCSQCGADTRAEDAEPIQPDEARELLRAGSGDTAAFRRGLDKLKAIAADS